MHRLDLFPSNEMISNYRQVFSSGAGLEVLSHIMYELGTFEDVTKSEEDVVLKNYGNRLLNILSGGEIDKSSIDVFVKKLMKQHLKKGE